MSATDFPEGAPNRMDRVRLALTRLVPEAARVRRLGLIVYGPGKNFNSCDNVEIKLRPLPDAAHEILQIAERLRPAGRTPLSRSVERAIDVLKEGPRPAEIVVLTDGEDTCGGDPCLLARRLNTEVADITIHVVGFRLPSSSETIGARCLADKTGGKFVTAETTAELTQALSQTLLCPEVALQMSLGRDRATSTQPEGAVPVPRRRSAAAIANRCTITSPNRLRDNRPSPQICTGERGAHASEFQRLREKQAFAHNP